jgi:hypothetical protein
LIAIRTDDSVVITAAIALVVLLTGMTVYVLSRPGDLSPTPKR